MSLRKLRLLTAGESHGPAVTAILEGIPAGLPLSLDDLRNQMKRRQLGYGRGGRMKIETDDVEITGGLRHGVTLGTPIGFSIRNRDFANWADVMSVWEQPAETKKIVRRPRPGHADLAGGLKYSQKDLRNVLERASARETVARVAAGSVCRQLLQVAGIQIASHVTAIGAVELGSHVSWEKIQIVQNSDVLRCVDPELEKKMVSEIDQAKAKKETVGGIFEVVARGVLPGLGSHVQWDQKLDGRIAQAMLSVPAVKAVAIGDAFQQARGYGSAAHDEIFHQAGRGFYHTTNRAGGVEGGVTNGEEIRVTGAMKPLSTLMKPLQSVDIASKQPEEAVVERSDICAVPAAGVVAEAMMALVLTDAMLEKFSCDTLTEFTEAIEHYRRMIASY